MHSRSENHRFVHDSPQQRQTPHESLAFRLRSHPSITGSGSPTRSEDCMCPASCCAARLRRRDSEERTLRRSSAAPPLVDRVMELLKLSSQRLTLCANAAERRVLRFTILAPYTTACSIRCKRAAHRAWTS
eukprot:scaffold226296_cov26-Tisochrysis_lutea.AAC.2